MQYCKRCVNPDTRPNIEFTDGVCLACRLKSEITEKVDWDVRYRELIDIMNWGAASSKSNYDCIVGVSGGKDSTRQALHVRDELGYNPLLVCCTYPPEQIQDRGANNLANLISHGFDTITVGPDPQLWKRLMREGFVRFGNWCRATEMALYSIPVHVAIAYKIPLILLGENTAYTLGEKESSLDGNANRMKYSNTLGGGSTRELRPEGTEERQYHFYEYPADWEMEAADIRIIYLGYYMPDFNSFANAEFSIAHGLHVRDEDPSEIGDITGHSALDEDFVIVNQFLKYLKFGFGKVTDQVCEAMYFGLMDREEGVRLVNLYDGRCSPRFIRRFCQYIGVSEETFWSVAERYRGKDVWTRDEKGEWTLKVRLC